MMAVRSLSSESGGGQPHSTTLARASTAQTPVKKTFLRAALLQNTAFWHAHRLRQGFAQPHRG